MNETLNFDQPIGQKAQVIKRSKFYWGMSALLLLIVLAGFSRSFYLRPFFNVSDPTLPNAYFHGAVMTFWYTAFFFQTSVAALGNVSRHRRLGPYVVTIGVGALIATAIATALLLPTLSERGITVTEAGLPRGSAIFWGNISTVLAFVVLLTLAVRHRRKPESHKRLMLFVFISTIGPALTRILGWPIVNLPWSNGDVITAALVVLMGIIVVHDLLVNRRVHAVTIGCSVFILANRLFFGLIVAQSEFGLSIAQALRR